MRVTLEGYPRALGRRNPRWPVELRYGLGRGLGARMGPAGWLSI